MENELDLYHGSPSYFKEFDAVFISNSLYGYGFNFTTDMGLARDFGDKIYTIQVPDDAKFFDFEDEDFGKKIYEKFIEDIESHGISSEYINDKNIDEFYPSFKEKFWMMQSKYISLLGLSRKDSMKRISDIIKSFGFIGTKYKHIYVIFDKDSFKIKNIRKLQTENFNFSNISNKVLNESLSQLAYHFTTLKRYWRMVDGDKLLLSTPYSTDVEINMDYGRGAKYYLSTTRIRDGRVGFSEGKNTRIELDTDFFNSRFHAGPVNYYNRTANKYVSPNEKMTENEDRVFSNVPILKNISRFINRVDVFLPIEDEELPNFKTTHYDLYTMLRDIYNTPMGLKTFIYNNEMEFNRQGKNITEEILKIL